MHSLNCQIRLSINLFLLRKMLHFPLIILPHLIQGWPTCGFKATARYWVIEVDSHNGNTAYYWQHTAGVRITFFISTSMWEEALRGFWDQQLPTSFGTQLSTQLHPFPCWVLGPPGTYCCFLPGRYLLKNPSPYLKYWVGVWHLLDIGSFILFFFFFKMLLRPRVLSSHDFS